MRKRIFAFALLASLLFALSGVHSINAATILELSTSTSSTACPASPLSGQWDSTSNTCTISRTPYGIAIPSGTTLIIDSGVTLSIIAGSGINDGGVINNSGTIDNAGLLFTPSGFINNYGTIVTTGLCSNGGGLGVGTGAGATGGAFTNSGTTDILGCMYLGQGTINNQNGASITVENGGSFGSAGPGATRLGALHNYGAITVEPGGGFGFGTTNQLVTMYNYGTLTDAASLFVGLGSTIVNEASGTITDTGVVGPGSGISVSGTFDNHGTLDVNGAGCQSSGCASLYDGGSFTNYGTVNVVEGVLFALQNPVAIINYGSIYNSASNKAGLILGPFINEAGATITNAPTGSMALFASFVNHGTIYNQAGGPSDLPGTGLDLKSPYQGNPGGYLENYGVIDNPGGINSGGNITNEASGVITNTGQLGTGGFSPTQFFENDGTLTNQGSFFVGGGTFTNTNTFDNSGTFSTGTGSTFTNSGTVDFSAGGGGFFGSVTNQNGGVFTFESNSGSAVIGTFTNYGVVYNYGNLGTKPLGAEGPGSPAGTIDNFAILNNYGALPDGGFIINEASGTITNTGTGPNGGGIGVQAGTFNGVAFSGMFANYGTLENPGTLFNSGTTDNENTGSIDNPGAIYNACGATFINTGAFSGNPIRGQCVAVVAVSPSPSTVIIGNTVTFTVTVNGAHAPPTGTVAWIDLINPSQPKSSAGGTFSGSGVCALMPFNSTAGTCSITYTPSASSGTIYIVAEYFGDSIYSSNFGFSVLTIETPAQAVQALIQLKDSMNLPQGISTSLDAKLSAASSSINSGNNNAAVGQLNSFINEVNAQTGISITQVQGQELISSAQNIISALTS